MLYDDRFSGHLSHEDFRTPVTGAGGCTWPTIPAARYYLSSEDATGILSVLNVTGILVLPTTEVDPAHDVRNWFSVGHIYAATVFRKTWVPGRPGFDWDVELTISSPCGSTLQWHIEEPIRKCNYDILLGSRCCPMLPGSCTGDTFTAYQVEDNEITPP